MNGRLFRGVWWRRAASGVAGFYLTRTWIRDKFVETRPVEGASMQPVLNPDYGGGDGDGVNTFTFTFTFTEGVFESVFVENNVVEGNDRILIRRIDESNCSSLKRGDVITVVDPHDRRNTFVKRVVGLPGDVVETLHWRRRRLRIPEGHCWVEGDNHADSVDSNDFGPVPLGLVEGKAVGIVWPRARMRVIRHGLSRECEERVVNS